MWPAGGMDGALIIIIIMWSLLEYSRWRYSTAKRMTGEIIAICPCEFHLSLSREGHLALARNLLAGGQSRMDEALVKEYNED